MMATPTLSLAMGSKRRQSPTRSSTKDELKVKNLVIKSSAPVNDNKNVRKFWGEEANEDSIYSIYMKKITYSFNYDNALRNDHKLDDQSMSSGVYKSRDDVDSDFKVKDNNRKTTWYDVDQQV